MKRSLDKYNVRSWILIFLVSITLIVLIVHLLFTIPGIIRTQWTASDALDFGGSILAAFVSFLLAYVARQQNKRILDLEDERYISTNACIAFVNRVTVRGHKSTACNYELHSEQIVATNKTNELLMPDSLIMEIEMNISDIPAAYVKVEKVLFAINYSANKGISTMKNQTLLDLASTDTEFSQVAISREGIAFGVLLSMEAEEKEKVVNSLQNKELSMILKVDYKLASNRNVISSYRSTADLVYIAEETSKDQDIFEAKSANPPYTFWYGNSKLDEDFGVKEM